MLGPRTHTQVFDHDLCSMHKAMLEAVGALIHGPVDAAKAALSNAMAACEAALQDDSCSSSDTWPDNLSRPDTAIHACRCV